MVRRAAPGNTGKNPGRQLKKQLAARPTIYLPAKSIFAILWGGFDFFLPAMARRGPPGSHAASAFGKYDSTRRTGAKHQTVIVPLCGHNARCMYTSETALPILFPRP